MLVKYTVSEFLSAKGSFSSIDVVAKIPWGPLFAVNIYKYKHAYS